MGVPRRKGNRGANPLDFKKVFGGYFQGFWILSGFLDPFWVFGSFLKSLDPLEKTKMLTLPLEKLQRGPMCNITLADREFQNLTKKSCHTEDQK